MLPRPEQTEQQLRIKGSGRKRLTNTAASQYYTVTLWMPRERMGFSINDSRTNEHQDIDGNVELDSHLPLDKISPNCIKNLHGQIKTTRSFSEETCKRIILEMDFPTMIQNMKSKGKRK